MAFAHQERWLEYVLSKIAEIKGTSSYDSALNKRNMVDMDIDIDDLLKRVDILEKKVEALENLTQDQGDQLKDQLAIIEDNSKLIEIQGSHLERLQAQVDSM